MSSDSRHIIDTVVLLYFLLAEQEELLVALLGHPLQAPLAVYDPEDRTLPPSARLRSELLSEMRQALRHYEGAASTGGDAESLTRVARVDALHDEGSLVAVPMTGEEQLLAARLQSSEAAEYGLRVPLGPGEAACIAISFARGWTIVTDDSDAFKVLDALHGKRVYRYERIRRLLVRAANQGLATREEVNAIHATMRAHGFWDLGRPFSGSD